MIIDLIRLFRARHNPEKATRLAVDMAEAQMFDRFMLPLLAAHIVLATLLLICVGLIAAALYVGYRLHWVVALLGIIPLGIAWVIAYILRGLRAANVRVRMHADRLKDAGVNRILKAGSKTRLMQFHSNVTKISEDDLLNPIQETTNESGSEL